MLSRVLTVVLLDSSDAMGPKWGPSGTLSDYVIFVEVCVHCLFRIIRGDIYYWIKLPRGHIPFGIFARFSTYTMGAFTGFMKLRHPFDVGGLSFSFSVVWSFVLSFIAFNSYNISVSKILPSHEWRAAEIMENRRTQLDNIWMIIVFNFILWFVSALIFFGNIKHGYLKTFISTQCSSDFLADNFLLAKVSHRAERGCVGGQYNTYRTLFSTPLSSTFHRSF